MGLIDSLTMDFSDCVPYPLLSLSWSSIENTITCLSITFIRAEIGLPIQTVEPWSSSIRKINFTSCSFESIPPRAFEGLNQLEEINFISNYIRIMNSEAISKLKTLKIVRFTDSSIRNIQQNAITQLPELYMLKFEKCDIISLVSNAIHIRNEIDSTSSADECPELDVRIGPGRDNRVIGNVLQGNMESENNLILPESGARLLIYQTNISIVEESAINSNKFAFMILEKNLIIHLMEKAFNVELDNRCEISASVVRQNTIDVVASNSFAGIQNRPQAKHKTFFALINNTFNDVKKQGFRLHPGLTISEIDENMFACECPNFTWYHYAKMYPSSHTLTREQELHDLLLQTSQCTNERIKFEQFLGSCTNDTMSSMIPSNSPTVDPNTENTNMHISDASANHYFPCIVIVNVLFQIILFVN